MKHFLFLALLCTSTLMAQEDEVKENPIDIALQQCLDNPSGQTTVGMSQCVIAAGVAWDKEMNKYYKLLMAGLKPAEQQQLKEAQKQWLLYRDKEFAFVNSMYGNKQGTMWQNVVAGRRTDIVKQRALELIEYYEQLDY